MKIKKTEMRVFEMQAFCDCGGEFIATGEVLASLPPQYVHRCDKCETTMRDTSMYPVTSYESKNNE